MQRTSRGFCIGENLFLINYPVISREKARGVEQMLQAERPPCSCRHWYTWGVYLRHGAPSTSACSPSLGRFPVSVLSGAVVMQYQRFVLPRLHSHPRCVLHGRDSGFRRLAGLAMQARTSRRVCVAY